MKIGSIPRVQIESPFRPGAGNTSEGYHRELVRNIKYAQLAILDSLKRGEAPFASHLLYTQVWSESEELRNAGINAGLAWSHAADLHAFYLDRGLSDGMRRARESTHISVAERFLFSSQEEMVAELDRLPAPSFQELRKYQ